jgi:hypothetical protein
VPDLKTAGRLGFITGRELAFHCTDCNKVLYLCIFLKSVEKIQV